MAPRRSPRLTARSVEVPREGSETMPAEVLEYVPCRLVPASRATHAAAIELVEMEQPRCGSAMGPHLGDEPLAEPASADEVSPTREGCDPVASGASEGASTSCTYDHRLPAEFHVPLPPPVPRHMGNQDTGARDPITNRWFHKREYPGAPPRGHNRFILCECGWLVHLNSAGKAYAREHHVARQHRYRGEVGEHHASSACTNFHCTLRSDHRAYRLRHLRIQRERRARVLSGDAILVTITG